MKSGIGNFEGGKSAGRESCITGCISFQVNAMVFLVGAESTCFFNRVMKRASKRMDGYNVMSAVGQANKKRDHKFPNEIEYLKKSCVCCGSSVASTLCIFILLLSNGQ